MKQKLFNWIGGKKWLAKELNQTFSNYKNIDVYAEPFAGGLGSFFFTLDTLKKINVKKVYLNDINNTIIATYRLIKSDYKSIYKRYEKIELEYKKTIPEEAYSLHKTKQKIELKELLQESRDYYNYIKSEFNKEKDNNSIESVSLFLFLAHHCFNGVYRENKKGEFNTPYNWEPGVPNFDSKLELLNSYSKIFNKLDIEFSNMDCFNFMEHVLSKESNILLYCDPPYLNLEIGENQYNKEHFGKNEQMKLLEFYKRFNNVVFSNHFYEIFEDFCNKNSFKYEKCYRANIMSSKNETRGNKVTEILAYKID
jgi:DNA adenine methylase